MRALRIWTMAGLLGMAMPTAGGLLDMAAYSAGREGEGGAAPKNPQTPEHRNWRETPIGKELHELNVLYHDGKIDQQEYMQRFKGIAEKAKRMKPDNKAIKAMPLDFDIPSMRVE